MKRRPNPIIETRAAIVWALTSKPRTLLDLFYTVGIQPTPASAQATQKWLSCLRKHGLIEVVEGDCGAIHIIWTSPAGVEPEAGSSALGESSADRHALTMRLLISRPSTTADLARRLHNHGFSDSNGAMCGLSGWLETLEREGVVRCAPGQKAVASAPGRAARVWSWAATPKAAS